ncbi:hypothetical protein A2U01_0074645, partial [Trifolium medium]|nr:hypothetical protein [Trifolium medium]
MGGGRTSRRNNVVQGTYFAGLGYRKSWSTDNGTQFTDRKFQEFLVAIN